MLVGCNNENQKNTKVDNCKINEPITRAELDVMIQNNKDLTKVCTKGIKDFSDLRFSKDFNQDISNWVIKEDADTILMYDDSKIDHKNRAKIF